jgi:hypothetical protein
LHNDSVFKAFLYHPILKSLFDRLGETYPNTQTVWRNFLFVQNPDSSEEEILLILTDFVLEPLNPIRAIACIQGHTRLVLALELDAPLEHLSLLRLSALLRSRLTMTPLYESHHGEDHPVQVGLTLLPATH